MNEIFRMVIAGIVLTAGIAWAVSADAAEYRVGAMVLTDPFSRATLPNQPVAGAFLTIENTGTAEDVLVSVSADFAGTGEIHEMSMQGEMMRMRPLPDGLPIAAGETVALMPGGYHLMFSDLTQPLVEGETVEATLQFRDAGSVTIPFTVLGKGAAGMAQSH